MAAARPQLDEEEAEEEEEAAEEAPAEGEEAAAPAGEEGEEAAPAEGGQMGEVECFAAEKCLGTYNQDKVSAEGLCLPLPPLMPSMPPLPLPFEVSVSVSPKFLCLSSSTLF